jgi:hypothetical protein
VIRYIIGFKTSLKRAITWHYIWPINESLLRFLLGVAYRSLSKCTSKLIHRSKYLSFPPCTKKYRRCETLLHTTHHRCTKRSTKFVSSAENYGSRNAYLPSCPNNTEILLCSNKTAQHCSGRFRIAYQVTLYRENNTHIIQAGVTTTHTHDQYCRYTILRSLVI